MSEEEPVMRLNLPEGMFEAKPTNSALFTFVGSLASRSHVFLIQGREDEKTLTGHYIFSQSAVFDDMYDFMTTNMYPCHLNLQDIAECDEDAYQKFIDQNVASEPPPDFMPDDWL